MRRAIWVLVVGLVACGDDDGGARDGGATDGGLPRGCAAPLDDPRPNCQPSPVPSTGDVYADCVARINQFRAECQCLPPLSRWVEGERCADEHAEYDSVRPPHSGFRDNICTNGGNAQNECPGWGSEDAVIGGCLQAMWDEGPGEDFAAHGHYINMSNPAYTQVACGFHTTGDGRVWAVQNFR
ncbi:MAG: CAP domain-containing protein [Myxococcota bacterium]